MVEFPIIKSSSSDYISDIFNLNALKTKTKVYIKFVHLYVRKHILKLPVYGRIIRKIELATKKHNSKDLFT